MSGSYRRLAQLVVLTLAQTALSEVSGAATGALVGVLARGPTSGISRIGGSMINMLVLLLLNLCTRSAWEWTYVLLSASWHERLQTHITRLWLSKRRVFVLSHIDDRIKNADQIISQEMTDLADQFTKLWGSLVHPVVDITWFSWRLFQLVGTTGASGVSVYNFAVWLLLQHVMPDYSTLSKRAQETEAHYRFVQGRVRDHSESVAFFGGGERERDIADACFDDVMECVKDKQQESVRFTFLKCLLTRSSDDPSRILSTSMYMESWLLLIAGEIMNDTSGQMYTVESMRRVVDSFAKLSNVYEDVSKLHGTAERVCSLLLTLEDCGDAGGKGGKNLSVSADGSVAVEDLDLVTPRGVCLASGLKFTLPAGKSLMVTGPNSSGKSSCFRVLAGMWPMRKGRASRPEDLMLIPQRVYSVTGTLMDQVTYPVRHRPRTKELEERARAALEVVGVTHLIEREGWDANLKFEDVLSLGEQQRVGLARLFFHRPAVGILDECTSAVSADAEERMLAALVKIGVCCVTMSQRLALEEFHDFQLKLGEPTAFGWEFLPIAGAATDSQAAA
eukprot:NODE_4169_length_1927_cov_4.325000.p1 GENE.NODE_4169_length_1927_cov_4.325000~~NODE_4169_length_1927_cov_4.325000.p1  ORF type:complete len:570 (+),score=185.67 NODE_4169_length_1927_cov_4.325000:25-1710(+)